MQRSNISSGELTSIADYAAKMVQVYNALKAQVQKIVGEASTVSKGFESAQAAFIEGYKEGADSRSTIINSFQNLRSLIMTFVNGIQAKVNEIETRIQFYKTLESNCRRAALDLDNETGGALTGSVFDTNAKLRERAEARFNINGNTVTRAN